MILPLVHTLIYRNFYSSGNKSRKTNDIVLEELKYEAAICDDLQNDGIEQTVFNEGELSEIHRKERILMEIGDKGYYRCKSIHKTAYTKITQTLQKYMTDVKFAHASSCIHDTVKRSIKQKCECVCTRA